MKAKRFNLMASTIVGSSCLVLAGTVLAQDKWTKEAADRYKKADEGGRLALCIEAINKKLICEGCKVENIDRLFATSFVTPDESTKGFDDLYDGVVDFGPPPPPPPKDESIAAAGQKGWYLEFKYDKSGNIVSYSLSNMRK